MDLSSSFGKKDNGETKQSHTPKPPNVSDYFDTESDKVIEEMLNMLSAGSPSVEPHTQAVRDLLDRVSEKQASNDSESDRVIKEMLSVLPTDSSQTTPSTVTEPDTREIGCNTEAYIGQSLPCSGAVYLGSSSPGVRSIRIKLTSGGHETVHLSDGNSLALTECPVTNIPILISCRGEVSGGKVLFNERLLDPHKAIAERDRAGLGMRSEKITELLRSMGYEGSDS